MSGFSTDIAGDHSCGCIQLAGRWMAGILILSMWSLQPHFVDGCSGLPRTSTPRGQASMQAFIVSACVMLAHVLLAKVCHMAKSKRRLHKSMARDFPGGAVVKNPPANAGDTGLSPGLGRSHMLLSS